MSDRPRFFDDLAGVAGGAFSALAGVREEVGAIVRARVDEVLSTLNLVRREDFEVVRELASRARTAQEDADVRLSALEARIAALEARAGVAPEDAAQYGRPDDAAGPF
ncbi:protein of unknown function DUF526 [Gluconacetobacter diazotrophicus PA1 5]|uniref:Conserved protein n=2 Tax=Gluconacetobacter diazotrophicus TaxID=33996 RepID=A9HBX6_GLUDA|nr:accessory factor UbiK family protein [Gluconacetobacter diazotrophicus]ACI50878.1 protein of unknown function DUF526 [Gluconacetobacter diazotrophicus PA1 5]MBB2156186.1 accessory factor UbiK family protein [Gluconacetobacter diazotrophicus]TWB08668.1 hypothetical protein FBZ86_106167 [Gluconacetobacter diazotrophicus]CAP54870.1 conserved protein [Gluconacetobacter diazotrophicus PA1 5]